MHKPYNMQTGIIGMKEDEIRPKDIFEKFLELAREDAITFFSNKDEFESVNCPACENNNSTFEFEKSGFSYDLCNNCGTLYVNPRPKSDIIKQYYEHSKSTKYWAEHFYKDTEVQRREKIFKPRAKMIRDFVKKEIGGKVDVFADIGAGYGGFFEEARDINIAEKIIAIEPSDDLAMICENKGFDVIQSSLEESTDTLQHHVSLATSFELFEHLHSPKEFLDGVRNILADGGYFIFTTLN
ncbi:MAG: methyltransferase domain-containing protein, partial [ANME-2 cluster archaeon]